MSIGKFPEILTRAMLVGTNVSREIGRTDICLHFRAHTAGDSYFAGYL